MSKILGLKQLKKIRYKLEDEGLVGELEDSCDIIEEELKDYEYLKQSNEELQKLNTNYGERIDKLEKAFDTLSKDHEKAMKELSLEIEKNRVLEIIKKYFWLQDFQDFVALNGRLPKSLQEDYDLLKKALL